MDKKVTLTYKIKKDCNKYNHYKECIMFKKLKNELKHRIEKERKQCREHSNLPGIVCRCNLSNDLLINDILYIIDNL